MLRLRGSTNISPSSSTPKGKPTPGNPPTMQPSWYKIHAGVRRVPAPCPRPSSELVLVIPVFNSIILRELLVFDVSGRR